MSVSYPHLLYHREGHGASVDRAHRSAPKRTDHHRTHSNANHRHTYTHLRSVSVITISQQQERFHPRDRSFLLL
eukprot:24618-Eustigmatos_ZCMA.PRE.1